MLADGSTQIASVDERLTPGQALAAFLRRLGLPSVKLD
jgi:hypothetical protein